MIVKVESNIVKYFNEDAMKAGAQLTMNISELMIHLLQAIFCPTAYINTSMPKFKNNLLNNTKFLCIMDVRFCLRK